MPRDRRFLAENLSFTQCVLSVKVPQRCERCGCVISVSDNGVGSGFAHALRKSFDQPYCDAGMKSLKLEYYSNKLKIFAKIV